MISVFFKKKNTHKGYKKIHKCFKRFLYQEDNFNFSHLRRKLKFHIFSCLKLCFIIPKSLNSS